MDGKRIQRAKGHILLIQEDRFRLLDENGQAFLFTLSHKGSGSTEDLERWHTQNRPVLVEYEGEPDFESAVVHSIRPIAADASLR